MIKTAHTSDKSRLIKLAKCLTGTTLLFALSACSPPSTPVSTEKASLIIVENGHSPYRIVIPERAAASVVEASAEMQLCIKKATGVALPVVTDKESLDGPFISLGATQQAQQFGIDTKELAYDGYHIATRDGNLFIIGIDTTATVPPNYRISATTKVEEVIRHDDIPGPSLTEFGGFSTGTANGVYSFLEDQLNVRWLMPGNIGRDIPQIDQWIIPEQNLTYAPTFIYRVITNIGRYKESSEWTRFQKLGYSLRLNHNHAPLIPTEMWKEHPEWFPMDASGKRPKPKSKNDKIETTNPEVVDYVAKLAADTLKAQPDTYTFTISPTDGLGYSESPESKALYDPEPSPEGLSVTPLILKFYKEVADRVGEQYPKGKVVGILYQRYVYPPSDRNIYFSKNFIPVLVSKATRYTFHNKEVRERNFDLIKTWGQYAPSPWFYYDFPYWLRYDQSIIAPTTPEYLTELCHTLVENGVKGVFFYGSMSWTHKALHNYLEAKMLWNPEGDAKAIQHDWLTRAYGPEAGAIMEKFYQKMDEDWFGAYFQKAAHRPFDNSAGVFSQIYGRHYKDMEALILEAERQPMTDVQKTRLRFISDNMRVLQWRLRNAGYLPADYQSPYTISSREVFNLMSNDAYSDGVPSFGGYRSPSKHGYIEATKIENAKVVDALPSTKQSKDEDPLIWLVAQKSGEVKVQVRRAKLDTNFLYYFLKNAKGNAIARGMIEGDGEIVFEAKAGEVYSLEITPMGFSGNPVVQWELFFPQAALAKSTLIDQTLHLQPVEKDRNAELLVSTPSKLPWEVTQEEGGLSVGTESEDALQSRRDRENQLLATSILEDKAKEYHADVLTKLNTHWEFITDADKTGKEKGYADLEYKTKGWTKVTTLLPWQKQGFPDYHGTAWYRKSFPLTSAQTADDVATGNKRLLLYLGNIDGEAEVFFNGQSVLTHDPTQYANGYDMPLICDITDLYRVGDNVIAIQVSKDSQSAGLYRGAAILQGTIPESKKEK